MTTLLQDRPITRDPEVTVRVVTDPVRGGGGGRRFGGGNLLTTAGLGAIALAVFLVVGAITGFLNLGGLFESSQKTTSTKVLLTELKNLSSYNAAQGTYQVDVGRDGNAPVLPDFIWANGGDITFRAVGSVNATVDFGVLATDAVQVSSTGGVSITLPPIDLGGAVIDPRESAVINHDRGLFDRIADMFEENPTSEREFYILGEKRISKAAKESRLTERAEENTVRMLEGFLARLGFSDVTITFEQPASKADAKK
jgi:hypothetical protein